MCEFSLITVCLNPGEKLRGTLESALRQTYGDFELLIKDGGSTDGSIEGVSDLLEDPRIRVINRKDKSIYDAMNQAVEESKGQRGNRRRNFGEGRGGCKVLVFSLHFLRHRGLEGEASAGYAARFHHGLYLLQKCSLPSSLLL